jgi:hypothetical protein
MPYPMSHDAKAVLAMLYLWRRSPFEVEIMDGVVYPYHPVAVPLPLIVGPIQSRYPSADLLANGEYHDGKRIANELDPYVDISVEPWADGLRPGSRILFPNGTLELGGSELAPDAGEAVLNVSFQGEAVTCQTILIPSCRCSVSVYADTRFCPACGEEVFVESATAHLQLTPSGFSMAAWLVDGDERFDPFAGIEAVRRTSGPKSGGHTAEDEARVKEAIATFAFPNIDHTALRSRVRMRKQTLLSVLRAWKEAGVTVESVWRASRTANKS